MKTLSQLLREANWRACVFSVLTAILVEIPFAILSTQGPHSGSGGLGMLFFIPSYGLVSLFSTERTPLVAVLLCQTVLISLPLFWIFTWRRRSIVATLVWILSFAIIWIVASGVLIRFEQRQAERDAAIREATGNAVVSSIETLNTSLASFRAKYGEYPARLEQLNFPSEGPVNSDRAGLAKFPMPVEQFFVFSYTASRTSGGKYFGYEFYADPKPGKWSELDHYYSDESGLIHFDVSHDSCKRGLIVSQQLHPSVTVE